MLWGMGLSTSSVHHVAVPSHWTTSPLALTSFPRKVLLEEWRDAEHFPVSHSGDPASPTGDTELVPVVSPPVTAREQRLSSGTTSWLPLVLDLITLILGQWG